MWLRMKLFSIKNTVFSSEDGGIQDVDDNEYELLDSLLWCARPYYKSNGKERIIGLKLQLKEKATAAMTRK